MAFWKINSAKEMVLFSRQLSTLIGAKVSILQALRILLEQVTNAYLKKVISETISSIEVEIVFVVFSKTS